LTRFAARLRPAPEPANPSSHPDSPEPLLQRVARGESDAVQACIDRHGPLVWALARRASSSHADAEDAVQEIFIDLWSSASRFDPAIASETTFVALIARRRLVDRHRRLGRRPESAALPAEIVDLQADHLHQVDRRDEARAALQALATLSPDQQRALVLSLFHHMTYDQIAHATGWPLGTVKTHARRGLQRLRKLLDPSSRSTRNGDTP
jgi:RNA polymerase sigma-70 factor (ECF subfamily)